MRSRVNYRRIWEKHHGKKIPKGFHIHHKDGNPNNNDISNLEMLSPEQHAEAHRNLGHKVMDNFIGKAGIWHTFSEKEKTSIRQKISDKVSGIHKGKVHTDDAKRNMSLAHKGQVSFWKGKKLSEDTKRKISESKLGTIQSLETRTKRRESMLSRKRNRRGSHGLSRKVMCTLTGKIWECIKDASEELGINYVTMKQYLKKPRPTKYKALLTLKLVEVDTIGTDGDLR